MDSLIRSSKNVINALIISAVLSTPVYAKKKQSYTSQNKIFATSYVVQDIDTGEIVIEKNNIAKKLATEAIKRGSTDNISCMILFF